MKKVAIVGAGPCGLSLLYNLHQAKEKGAQVEFVCFEKQPNWGGLWNHDQLWRTGVDEYGQPVHGSMYFHLWSNGPKECLELPEYTFDDHFGKPIGSFPPRAVLADYITARAKKASLQPYVKLSHAVTNVSFDAASDKFTVSVKDLASDQATDSEFDYVVVASGHFSTPNIPTVTGVETFQGRVLHSHDFRNGVEFKGKKLLIIGNGYSGEDIALQCHKYGAQNVIITYRTQALGFTWPEGVEERPLVDRIDGNTVHFPNGTTAEVDAIILCTGYRHFFPFLPESLCLRTKNVLAVPGLYKGVVYTKNPKLLYLGMQDQFYTFTMFEVQAWFATAVLTGKHQLPSAAEMQADVDAELAKEAKHNGCNDQIDYQTEYVEDLRKICGYERSLDVSQLFKEWEHHKVENIMTYRDRPFKSIFTGTVAPDPATPWRQNYDDSLAGFTA